jgi:osmotically-inducible protein OsmY
LIALGNIKNLFIIYKMGSEVVGFDENYSKQYGSMSGGKRKSKGKRSNGHKETCACPICKNMMKKGKKGGVLLVGGTLPEAAQKLREAADALEDTKTSENEEEMNTKVLEKTNGEEKKDDDMNTEVSEKQMRRRRTRWVVVVVVLPRRWERNPRRPRREERSLRSQRSPRGVEGSPDAIKQ